MSIRDRIDRIEHALALPGMGGRKCRCEGERWITLDGAGRMVCDWCGGLVPPDVEVTLPEGAIPAPPDEI